MTKVINNDSMNIAVAYTNPRYNFGNRQVVVIFDKAANGMNVLLSYVGLRATSMDFILDGFSSIFSSPIQITAKFWPVLPLRVWKIW